MTKIDIHTEQVEFAGKELLKHKDWNNVWSLLNRLSGQLSGLQWTADSTTRGYINSAQEAINKLQWEYLEPISSATDRLGNICLDTSNKFNELDEKWANHFDSARAEKVSTPLSVVFDSLKNELREPLSDLIKQIAEQAGICLDPDTVDAICENVLDALPGLAVDIIAALAGGVGIGLLIADLTNLVVSTIIDIKLDDNSTTDEQLQQLYSLSGVGVGYDKEDGFKFQSIKDTYYLKGENFKSIKGATSGASLVLDLDSKISSIEYNTGYNYQCFGRDSRKEKVHPRTTFRPGQRDYYYDYDFVSADNNHVDTETPLAKFQRAEKTKAINKELDEEAIVDYDKNISPLRTSIRE